MLIKKRENIVDSVENSIISLYAKRMSTTDIEDQIREFNKKWTMPIRNWGIILNQFLAIFENRIKL